MLSLPATADTVITSGKTCWTGEVEFMGTSQKDKAWVFKMDYVFLSDKGHPMEIGRCFGSGGLVDGTPDISTKFCSAKATDGGAYMSHHAGDAKSASGVYFGGTEQYADMDGGFEGGEVNSVSMKDGKLAGCRPTTREMTGAELEQPQFDEPAFQPHRYPNQTLMTSFFFGEHPMTFVPAANFKGSTLPNGLER